jgi:hypothetical protein
MTKQDRIGVTLRKLDYLWLKKGVTFCQAVKQMLGGDFKDLTDEELIIAIKDIEPDKKH